MYEPGETVVRYFDRFPASVSPWVAPFPVLNSGEAQSVMLRIIVTDRYLTAGWQFGQTIYRLDIAITPEQRVNLNSTNGVVAGFTIGEGRGCRCQANKLQTWDPFPGVNLVGNPAASPAMKDPATYGLVPVRYTRV